MQNKFLKPVVVLQGVNGLFNKMPLSAYLKTKKKDDILVIPPFL